MKVPYPVSGYKIAQYLRDLYSSLTRLSITGDGKTIFVNETEHGYMLSTKQIPSESAGGSNAGRANDNSYRGQFALSLESDEESGDVFGLVTWGMYPESSRAGFCKFFNYRRGSWYGEETPTSKILLPKITKDSKDVFVYARIYLVTDDNRFWSIESRIFASEDNVKDFYGHIYPLGCFQAVYIKATKESPEITYWEIQQWYLGGSDILMPLVEEPAKIGDFYIYAENAIPDSYGGRNDTTPYEIPIAAVGPATSILISVTEGYIYCLNPIEVPAVELLVPVGIDVYDLTYTVYIIFEYNNGSYSGEIKIATNSEFNEFKMKPGVCLGKVEIKRKSLNVIVSTIKLSYTKRPINVLDLGFLV